MEKNKKAVEMMLEEEGLKATEGAKKAIPQFCILFARKLIRISLYPNQNKITETSIR